MKTKFPFCLFIIGLILNYNTYAVFVDLTEQKKDTTEFVLRAGQMENITYLLSPENDETLTITVAHSGNIFYGDFRAVWGGRWRPALGDVAKYPGELTLHYADGNTQKVAINRLGGGNFGIVTIPSTQGLTLVSTNFSGVKEQNVPVTISAVLTSSKSATAGRELLSSIAATTGVRNDGIYQLIRGVDSWLSNSSNSSNSSNTK